MDKIMWMNANNMSNPESYSYERWPSDLLNWWQEVWARLPNITQNDFINGGATGKDYKMFDELAPGYIEGVELDLSRPGLITELEARALRITSILRIYYTPTVTLLGLVLSLLSLPVLLRVGRSTRSSHIPYLMGLSVCAGLYLAGLLLIWLGSLGVNIYSVPGTCQFTAFTSQASHFLYTWVLVAMVTDRLAVQLFNLKMCPSWLALMLSQSSARVFILIFTTLALAVFFNLSMMKGTVHLGKDLKICVVIVEYLHTSLILDKIDAVLNFFIPSLMLVGMDIALIINHCRLKLRQVPHEINPLSSETFSIDILQPSPSSSSSTTESSTPEPTESPIIGNVQIHQQHHYHYQQQQTSMEYITPSVSSIIATVVTSGLFVTLSIPNTIQRIISTFTNDHLLFTMTARGILYQHVFANIFYTIFPLNILLTFLIDADIGQQSMTLVHKITQKLCVATSWECTKSPCCCYSKKEEGEGGESAGIGGPQELAQTGCGSTSGGDNVHIPSCSKYKLNTIQVDNGKLETAL